MVQEFAAAMACLVLAAGCATETRTYDVRVRNDTSRPLTVVLVKDGGPYEDVWATPEQIVSRREAPGARWGMQVVEPGATASARDVKGQFPLGSRAWLRAYAGDLELGEMTKLGPASRQRVDVPLEPGRNDVVVRDEDGRLVASPGVPGRTAEKAGR